MNISWFLNSAKKKAQNDGNLFKKYWIEEADLCEGKQFKFVAQ